jgi:hypothetical protein
VIRDGTSNDATVELMACAVVAETPHTESAGTGDDVLSGYRV